MNRKTTLLFPLLLMDSRTNIKNIQIMAIILVQFIIFNIYI